MVIVYSGDVACMPFLCSNCAIMTFKTGILEQSAYEMTTDNLKEICVNLHVCRSPEDGEEQCYRSNKIHSK